MKRYFLRILALLLFFTEFQPVFSQNVGINNNGAAPDSSAILDLNVANKGLLIPRVPLISTNDVTTIANPQLGLLVFNSNPNTTSGAGLGFYYCSSTSEWWYLLTDKGSTAGWHVRGNVGTNSGVDFIGTRDSQDLVVATGGIEKMRVQLGGNIGVGTDNPRAKLDVKGAIYSGEPGFAEGELRLFNVGMGSHSIKPNPLNVNQLDFVLPPSHGAAGEALVTDGLGNTNWSDLATTFNWTWIFDTFLAAQVVLLLPDHSWQLNGNAGTNPGVDFIGTSDNQDLVLATAGNEKMRVQLGGNIGIGTPIPRVKLDVIGSIYSGEPGFSEGELRLFNLGPGSHAIKPNPMNANQLDLVLPPDHGVFGDALVTDGLGNTSWRDLDQQIVAILPNHSWQLDGNAGTNPGQDFIGTTDVNDLIVATNGLEKMRIKTGGDIGIGTPIPRAKLDVKGPIYSGELGHAGELKLFNVDSGGHAIKPNPMITGQLNLVLPPNNGNPNDVLVTDGNGNLEWSLSQGENAWQLTGNLNTVDSTNFLGTLDSAGLSIGTDSLERMRFLATGQIGIGTALPVSFLHIGGDTRIGLVTDNNNNTPSLGSKLYFSGGGDWGNTDSENSDSIWVARFNTGDDSTELRINIGDIADPNDKFVVGHTDSISGWESQFIVQMDGKVGVGRLAPERKLDVNGEIRTGRNGTDGRLEIYSDQFGPDYTYAIVPNGNATQDVTLTLPPNDGDQDDILYSDGFGSLDWAPAPTPTKEIFIPVTGNGGNPLQTLGTFPVATIQNPGDASQLSFMVPGDFVSIDEIQLIFIPTAITGQVDMQVGVNYGEIGQDFNQMSSGPSPASASGGLNKLTVLDLNQPQFIPVPLTAFDLVGVEISHSPTGGDDLEIIGIRLKYN